MRHVGDFFWLACQAAQVAIFWEPLLALIAIALLVVAVAAWVHNPAPFKGKWFWLALPIYIPIAILLFGAAFWYSGPIGTAPRWREQVVWGLMWSHIPVGIVLTVVFRKNAAVPLGLSAATMLYSFGAALMASMAVTKIWL